MEKNSVKKTTIKEQSFGERSRQITDTLIMVSPDSFRYDPITAATNTFSRASTHIAPELVPQVAMEEFQGMVTRLRQEGVQIIVLPNPGDTPNAVFPNNWISFHDDGKVVVYPMKDDIRSQERQLPEVVNALQGIIDFSESKVVDFSSLEEQELALEGTGSLVIDRRNNVVFAVESARTSLVALEEFCDVMDMEPISFHAFDKKGNPVYHTNVVMSVGDGYSVVCLDSIPSEDERTTVENELKKHGLVIKITTDQMGDYCGNILQISATNGDRKILMSTTAHNAFTAEQKMALRRFGKLVAVDIPVIEENGGGSARCMVAEVFTQSTTSR